MKCCKKGESKDNMEELISALQKKHISYDVALRFLKSNKLFLNMTVSEIEDKVFALFNGPFLYAMLYVNGDLYYWTFYDYKNKSFSELFDCGKDDDYIIRMIIGGVNKMALFTNRENLSLQDKIKFASCIDVSGYNLK